MQLNRTLKHAALRTLAATIPASRTAFQQPKSFLILQFASALGTVLHATPLIRALRNASPQGTILAATSGFGEDVLLNNPHIDELVPIANPLKDWRTARKDIAALVSKMDGDVGKNWATVTPLGNERTAIALAAALGGARSLSGFTLAPQLYAGTLTFNPSRSQIANNLQIAEFFEMGRPDHGEPEAFFAADALNYIHARLGPERDAALPLVVFVTQTSPTQRKGWRANRFVSVAQWLVDRFSAQVAFVGTEVEKAAIEAIRGAVRGQTWNLAGQTNLPQLSALLSLCDVGLTLDTGTMHLGRAVGLPMVIVAPAWSPPIEWLPLNNPRYTILKNATMAQAPADYVIDEVSTDEVTAALTDLLQRYPPGSRQRIAISSR